MDSASHLGGGLIAARISVGQLRIVEDIIPPNTNTMIKKIRL